MNTADWTYLAAELAKTTEVEELRFGDKDVDVVGTLEYGQYGVVSPPKLSTHIHI